MILKSDSITFVRGAIRNWVVLLSDGRFEEAAREISTQGSPCSEGLLTEAIGRYCRKYREAPAIERAGLVPKITSPHAMEAQGENIVIYVKNDLTVIEYDFPIENVWSDLTAKFRLAEQAGTGYELSLIDIRVL